MPLRKNRIGGNPFLLRHPERSRISGGARDLARIACEPDHEAAQETLLR